jgi:hypothetical protein
MECARETWLVGEQLIIGLADDRLIRQNLMAYGFSIAGQQMI